MPGELIKVLDGPVLTDVPADLAGPGDYCDDDGHPLTGIYVRDGNGVWEKLILSNGHARFGYRYPVLELAFESPLVNDGNLYCCREGWTWMDDGRPMNSDLLSIARVAEGRKAFGSCLLAPGQPYEETINLHLAGINAHELAVQPKHYENTGQFELIFARRERIGDLFHLTRFIEDWHRLIGASPKAQLLAGDMLDGLLHEIAPLRVSNFRDGFNFKEPQTVQHWIIGGLLLGYPVETTAYMACWHEIPDHGGTTEGTQRV